MIIFSKSVTFKINNIRYYIRCSKNVWFLTLGKHFGRKGWSYKTQKTEDKNYVLSIYSKFYPIIQTYPNNNKKASL